jgi:hypothetical protein
MAGGINDFLPNYFSRSGGVEGYWVIGSAHLLRFPYLVRHAPNS